MTSNDNGERIRLANALTPRQRRMWMNRLAATAEAIETAEEAQVRVVLEAYADGMSYANIGGVLGKHSTTIQDIVKKAKSNLRAGE